MFVYITLFCLWSCFGAWYKWEWQLLGETQSQIILVGWVEISKGGLFIFSLFAQNLDFVSLIWMMKVITLYNLVLNLTEGFNEKIGCFCCSDFGFCLFVWGLIERKEKTILNIIWIFHLLDLLQMWNIGWYAAYGIRSPNYCWLFVLVLYSFKVIITHIVMLIIRVWVARTNLESNRFCFSFSFRFQQSGV